MKDNPFKGRPWWAPATGAAPLEITIAQARAVAASLLGGHKGAREPRESRRIALGRQLRDAARRHPDASADLIIRPRVERQLLQAFVRTALHHAALFTSPEIHAVVMAACKALSKRRGRAALTHGEVEDTIDRLSKAKGQWRRNLNRQKDRALDRKHERAQEREWLWAMLADERAEWIAAATRDRKSD